MKLFDLMHEKGAIPEVIYTTIVETFCKASMLNNVLKIFKKMHDNGVIPNAFSYWLIMGRLCKGGTFDDAIGFRVELFEAGNSPNAATLRAWLILYARRRGLRGVRSL
jgi:pentatricopeptide repeat protein